MSRFAGLIECSGADASLLAMLAAALAGRVAGAREAIVIGAHQSKMARSLAWTARQRGIASVYVPHAPMLQDRRWWDLPVDYGALRGQGEVETYPELGVSPQVLEAIGDPGLLPVSPPELDPAGEIAFALPPLSRDQSMHAISVVHEARTNGVVVTPHPSQPQSHTPPGQQRLYEPPLPAGQVRGVTALG